MTAIEDVTPWYKQFWPWFIFLLPASVVVAGVITVIIAFKNADSMVVDDYYKQGLGINRQLAQDKQAEKLLAIIHAQIDTSTGQLRMELDGDFSKQPDSLLVNWIHPTVKAHDFSLTLVKSPVGDYVGQLQSSINGRWYVQASSDQPVLWRLKTELVISADQNDGVQKFGLGNSESG